MALLDLFKTIGQSVKKVASKLPELPNLVSESLESIKKPVVTSEKINTIDPSLASRLSERGFVDIGGKVISDTDQIRQIQQQRKLDTEKANIEQSKKTAPVKPFKATYYDPVDEAQTRPDSAGIGAFSKPVEFGDVAMGSRKYNQGDLIFVPELKDVRTPYGDGVFRVNDKKNIRYDTGEDSFDIAIPKTLPGASELQKRIGNNKMSFQLVSPTAIGPRATEKKTTIKEQVQIDKTPVQKFLDFFNFDSYIESFRTSNEDRKLASQIEQSLLNNNKINQAQLNKLKLGQDIGRPLSEQEQFIFDQGTKQKEQISNMALAATMPLEGLDAKAAKQLESFLGRKATAVEKEALKNNLIEMSKNGAKLVEIKPTGQAIFDFGKLKKPAESKPVEMLLKPAEVVKPTVPALKESQLQIGDLGVFDFETAKFVGEQPKIKNAIIQIGEKTYTGADHLQAIKQAAGAGEDISKINRELDGKFETTDGRIITRDQAQQEFGVRHSEEVPQLAVRQGREQATTPTAENNLIQEAKKYKSAEEFVKAQGTPVYHGTNAKFDKFDKSKIGEATGKGDWGDGFYFTDTKSVAKSFASDVGGNTVMEISLPKNLKFADGNKLEKLPEIQDILDDGMGFTDIGKYLKSKGYDGVKYTHNGDGGIEYVVYDPSNIKTKSQLTDIWNKAQAIKQPMADVLPSETIKEPSVTKEASKAILSTIGEGIQKPKVDFKIKPFEYVEAKLTKQTKLKQALQGELGAKKAAEIESAQAKREQINSQVVDAVKNTPYFKKEGDILDMMGQGTIYENPRTGRNVIAYTKEQGEKLFTKGWKRGMEIDQLAQEAGFERGEDFLRSQIQASKLPRSKDVKKAVEKELLATDKDFKVAVEKVKSVKGQQVPLGTYLTAQAKVEQMNARRIKLRALKEYFGLEDKDMRKIGRKDLRFMNDAEFEKYLGDLNTKVIQLLDKQQAKNELLGLIQEREFKKWENLKNAMELPPIEQMTTEQLRQFTQALEPYQFGDEFLGKRKLELVDRTELEGIKNLREARERLAKKINKPVSELNNIEVKELDRLEGDTYFAKISPFHKMIVDETNKSILTSELSFLNTKKEFLKLVQKANASRPRTFLQKLVPQNKIIVQYLEGDIFKKAELAKTMTKEELDWVAYMSGKLQEALDHLIKTKALEKGRENYFMHIQRGLLEAIKEDGVVQAFKEIMNSQKIEEQNFNILDRDTGNILPLEKFFSFAMHRTGQVKPTQNVTQAFLNYWKTFEKKRALDEILPSLDIYLHALETTKRTPRGLVFDRSLKNLVYEWINAKKGRNITLVAKQGGNIDTGLRMVKAFTSLLDLGLNIPVALFTYVGEQFATLQTFGGQAYRIGIMRMASKQGQKIINKYENFVGESVWKNIIEPGRMAGDRLMDILYGSFRDASRRANSIALLGSMTEEEFKSGTISTEKLAQLKLDIGKYRAVEGAESIVGKTPEAKILTQYKSWAIPTMRTTLYNLHQVAKKIGAKKIKEGLTSQEARELYRLFEITLGVVGIGVLIGVNSDDQSFVGKLKNKFYQEAMSLYGALDPKTLLSTPRTVKFVEDLAKNLSALIHLEQYKTKPGLKGWIGLKTQLTPKAIKQFMPSKTTSGKSTLKLPGLDLPELPDLPSLPKL